MAAKDQKDDVENIRKKLFTITGRAVKMTKFVKLKRTSVSKQPPPPQSSDPVDAADDGDQRGGWGNKFDFILSSVGYAVGLGNVWRFPYLCYKNGGGAFLIPYTLMLLAAGLPMFVTELGFGQFASRGCVSVWTISPLFKGLGYCMCVLSGLVAIYYNVVITYTIFYLFSSFTSVLPWSDCNRPWNTPNCTVSKANGTNVTVFLNTSTRPSLEYWDHQCLGRSEGLEHMGPVRWQLALCLLLAWTVVFFCICRGVKSSGKVVYFTATFPYVVLVILLIRGATLPGSLQGVIYYIEPKFDKLLNARVWKDAAVQIFYSLGAAWGGLHTLASYNKFNNNFKRDGMIIAFINCGTSVFAGFVIFSVIGFMSFDSGLPIEVVADTGPGLAFVAYPEALARMPAAPFWSILFFFMLFTLGLDSEFVTMETLITAVCDELKYYYKDIYRWKTPITLCLCVIFFLLGLPMTTGGGIYLLTLMDEYCAGFSLLLIAFTECIVISYVYGIKKFMRDMSVMVPSGLGIYWKFCLMFLTPLIVFLIFISFCVTYGTLEYSGYVYSSGGEALGWLMVVTGIISLPAYAIFYLLRSSKGFTLQGLLLAMRPSPEWGPASNKHRIQAGYQPVGMDGSTTSSTYPGGQPSKAIATATASAPSYFSAFPQDSPTVQMPIIYHETSI
ncbi:sodium- and chloride-dependent glycine transporter 1-like [Acanthaster planci]|uniref:Transporter n=1 Tax=Acanthaster planci TaxID=133434 RepID=A0A8B7ZBM8_ACAPL|nr:sodium- and chloride-dependent glycine transporter 1-like [Acanthaster planci]XP_022103057.1 sodium- and chloride-dependent glycine transporter 1-like [Acanthaster planci]XP_022103058.1 sodium- and chloride-dependent glycine transporter 1-like [Acanthaster planci]